MPACNCVSSVALIVTPDEFEELISKNVSLFTDVKLVCVVLAWEGKKPMPEKGQRLGSEP